MNGTDPFLASIEAKAKMLAPAAKATFLANEELCSWLLNPLGRWAKAAYGETAFEACRQGLREVLPWSLEVATSIREVRSLHARSHARTHVGSLRRRGLHGSLHVGRNPDLPILALDD